MRRIFYLLVTVTLFHCVLISEPTYKKELEYKKGSNNELVVPFMAFSYEADYHVILYFEGHEKYESVEAFVFDVDSEYIFRAVLTDLNNNQVDYVNSEKLLGLRNNGQTKVDRKSIFTKGNFNISENKKDCQLNFDIDENNHVDLHYIGKNIPDNKHAGMTNPGGHSPNGGLPMMFRNMSSMGTNESYVAFNQMKYYAKEDPEKSSKPWFTAYKAYFADGFIFSLIPAHITEKELLHVENNQSTIVTNNIHGNKKIFLNSLNEITKIRYFSPLSKMDESFMEISFEPALPNLVNMKANQSTVIEFAVSYYNSNSKEIYGNISIDKPSLEDIKMEFSPEFPVWAKDNRKIEYDVYLDGHVSTIEARNKLM